MQVTEVAIIGGGPAGVAAMIWLHQLGIPTILLESSNALGGLQRSSPYKNEWIPGVDGLTGQEVAKNLHNHALRLGCNIWFENRVASVERDHDGFILNLQSGLNLHSQFVVLATGTVPVAAGFTETASVGIGPGESMVRLDVKNKNVAILGGGDNAFIEAYGVLERGAKGVTIFSRQEPRAQAIFRKRIPTACLEIGSFIADQNSMTVQKRHFDVIGVQFGFEPVSIAGLSPTVNRGYIQVQASGETSVKKVYACGDVTNFFHPCTTTAAAHGIQVAHNIRLAYQGKA